MPIRSHSDSSTAIVRHKNAFKAIPSEENITVIEIGIPFIGAGTKKGLLGDSSWPFGFIGGRYWDRTSGFYRVKVALSR